MNARPRPFLGAEISLIGAVVVIVGGLLPWATFGYGTDTAFSMDEYGFTLEYADVSGLTGPILLVCATLIAIAALVRISRSHSGRAPRLLICLAAVVALLVAGSGAMELGSTVRLYISQGGWNGTVQNGPLVAAAGGVIAFVGALLSR